MKNAWVSIVRRLERSSWWAAVIVVGALGACGKYTKPTGDEQLGSAAGEGTAGEQATTTGAGGRAELGGTAGTGGHPEAGHAGSELGGMPGMGGDESDPVPDPALEQALESELSGGTLVDAARGAGKTFILDECMGPPDTWNSWEAYRSINGNLGVEYTSRLTLHFKQVEGDRLSVIVSLPTPMLPWAEETQLERRGSIWVGRSFLTAAHMERFFDEEMTYSFYRAAFVAAAFADDDGDGEPDRVLFSATASLERVDYPFSDEQDFTFRGANQDVVATQGARIESKIGISVIEPDRYWFLRDVTQWNDLPRNVALSEAVASGTFSLTNDAGLHSELQVFTQGRFITGIKVRDFLGEGWTLRGSGTDLDGRPFELSQPFQSTELRPVSGDFETEPSFDCHASYYCEGGVSTGTDGLLPIEGAQSFKTEEAVRFRVSRRPGATQLTFKAVKLGGDAWLDLLAMEPGAKSQNVHVAALDNATTVTSAAVPLPPGTSDVLVTFPAGLWLDSISTE